MSKPEDKKPEAAPRTVAPMDPMLRQCSKIIKLLEPMDAEVRAWVLNYCNIKYAVAVPGSGTQ